MLRVLILAALFALAGCATGPVKQDIATELKASNIAVAYYMNHKNIHYSELVYKVLWNQTETQDAAFDGMWDIDKELSGRLTSILADQGLMAQSVHDVLGNGYAGFEQSVASTAWDSQARTPRRPLQLDSQTSAALAAKGIRYVILEQRAEFFIQVNSFINDVFVRTEGVLLVYDVEAGREVYQEGLMSLNSIEIGKASPRIIEDSKLARLKGAVRKSMDQSKKIYVEKLRLADAPG